MYRVVAGSLLFALVANGCGTWRYLSYRSTTGLEGGAKLPCRCEPRLRVTSDWEPYLKRSVRSGVDIEALNSSLRNAFGDDLASNVCAGGATAPVVVELDIRRLEWRTGMSFWMWFPLPIVGIYFGAPLQVVTGEADVEVRFIQGLAEHGSYRGTAKLKKYKGLYYGYDLDPSDKTRGGMASLLVKGAIESAKKGVSADRVKLVNAIQAPPAAAAPAPAVGGGLSPEARGKVTIAVADLAEEGVSRNDAVVIADVLRGELVRTGAFTVVEKKNMDKVLSEQAFQQTGCTDQACAVKLGKLLNAQRMVVGSCGKLLDKYFVNIRVVNVETGEATYADSARGKVVEDIEKGLAEMSLRMSKSAL
jgi:hypothetical protein